jgi:hypothetical protein
MSTAENGLASNIIANLPVSHAISFSSNTSPIQMTTATPHGLTTGDTVSVDEHQVNVSANGTWPVSVLNSTSFNLIGSTGVAVGANTGNVQSLALGPTFAIPSDGVDNEAAASVNVPFEALADRTACLATMTGAYKTSNYQEISNTDPTFAQWDLFPVGTMTLNAYNDLTGATTWTMFDVHINDFIDIRVDYNQLMSSSSFGAGFINLLAAIFYVIIPPGAATPAYTQVGGSAGVVTMLQSSSDGHHMALGGTIACATAGSLVVKIKGMVRAPLVADVSGWTVQGDYSVRAIRHRPTSMPQ